LPRLRAGDTVGAVELATLDGAPARLAYDGATETLVLCVLDPDVVADLTAAR